MGLNFKNSKAQWSYSGFNRFREKVARGIGIDLRNMIGFAPFNLSGKELDIWEAQAGSWKDIKSPLKYFLNHSDCEGQISAKRCGLIYPILNKIVLSLEDSIENEHDKSSGKELVKTMKDCAKNNKPLIFW